MVSLDFIISNCLCGVQTIGLYFGSFDPFHDGHMEVSEIMLNFCDIILITTVKKNKEKSWLSPYGHRVHMINNYLSDYLRSEMEHSSIQSYDAKFEQVRTMQSVIKDNSSIQSYDAKFEQIRTKQSVIKDHKGQPRIYFIEDDLIEAINELRSRYRLYGIMGSDVFLKFNTKKRVPRMKVHEWFIIPRGSDYITMQSYDAKFGQVRTMQDIYCNWNKKVTILDCELFKKQGFSSTEIREAFKQKNTQGIPLLEENIKYIQRHELYV